MATAVDGLFRLIHLPSIGVCFLPLLQRFSVCFFARSHTLHHSVRLFVVVDTWEWQFTDRINEWEAVCVRSNDTAPNVAIVQCRSEPNFTKFLPPLEFLEILLLQNFIVDKYVFYFIPTRNECFGYAVTVPELCQWECIFKKWCRVFVVITFSTRYSIVCGYVCRARF